MKNLLLLLSFFGSFVAISQSYEYEVNLDNCIDDKIKVSLEDIPFKGKKMVFNFPKTIPGTYEVQDFGKYIEDFKAYDINGTALKVSKKGNNTYIIKNAEELDEITYLVNDTWDAEVRENFIFQPAGNNFEKNDNFIINPAGIFGYFTNEQKHPFEVTFKKPTTLYGVSSLPSEANKVKQVFSSTDYFQLADSPILFAEPDTVSFNVANARVTIAVCSERDGNYSAKVYDELKESMEAIAAFTGDLPVDNYCFLIYLKDMTHVTRKLGDKDFDLSIYNEFNGISTGALEHGNSSLYYLLDFGDKEDVEEKEQLKERNYLFQMKDFAIHEFMHIFTPLNLHSQHIGNFNFQDPEMSKHLWLYEGITEYFAGLIQLQSGILNVDQYINFVLDDKFEHAKSFPHEKMSFTDMSANILKKKYAEQYMQVYSRGAIMGLLLDIEIMRLTNNQKTLKDVVIALSTKYGKDKSFDEESFINEFVNEVHPDLKFWFNNYVEGNMALPIAKQLDYIGILYEEEHTFNKPKSGFFQEGISFNIAPEDLRTFTFTVADIATDVETDLKEGDRVSMFGSITLKDDDGNWLEEGDTTVMTVERDGKDVEINYIVKVEESTETDYFGRIKKPSKAQLAARRLWANLKEE